MVTKSGGEKVIKGRERKLQGCLLAMIDFGKSIEEWKKYSGMEKVWKKYRGMEKVQRKRNIKKMTKKIKKEENEGKEIQKKKNKTNPQSGPLMI